MPPLFSPESFRLALLGGQGVERDERTLGALYHARIGSRVHGRLAGGAGRRGPWELLSSRQRRDHSMVLLLVHSEARLVDRRYSRECPGAW